MGDKSWSGGGWGRNVIEILQSGFVSLPPEGRGVPGHLTDDCRLAPVAG
jgi:hypothetical protein